MVKVKKRDGTIEEYVESKIVAGVRKAGATAEEAAQIVKEVAIRDAIEGEIAAEEISAMVVASLRKVNKKAADEFVKFRDNKLKAKKQKNATK